MAEKLRSGDDGDVGHAHCGKWCTIDPDGTCHLDETRIKSFLSQTQHEDSPWMRRVLRGEVLDATVYPLIFEIASSDAPDTLRLRSLPYFMEMLEDAHGTQKYRGLTPEKRKIVAVGVRDLFIADLSGLLSEAERDILQGMVKIIDEALEEVHMRGLGLSFHPSSIANNVKFVEDLDEKVGKEASQLYAQVMNTPRLFAVFVNPANLSYHNFENIVPLDSWLDSELSRRGSDLNLSLNSPTPVQSGREIFTCRLAGAANQLLKDLSQLDFYVPPLNKGARGGKRFIFHSALLSKALTTAVKSSNILDQLPEGLRRSFQFVNYVFRCNRFSPGDSHFQSHLDTPYYDGARSHVSKYTLLINLNAGSNNPALRIKDVCIDDIKEATCLIFDQRYEHEGWPFLDGHKVFIRSELVFKDEQLSHDDRISSLFSEACYMTGQSMSDRSLSSYANECFERANSLHWAVEKSATQPPVYLFKDFQGIRFLTNGHRYWFLKSPKLSIKECALVALLDFFNCKVGQERFASLVKSTKIQRKFESTAEIWLHLSSVCQSPRGLRKLKQNDVDALIKTGPSKPLEWMFDDWDGEPEELEDFAEDGDGCCPMHSFPMFNPWKSKDVIEAYGLCSDYARKMLFGAPFLILNEEIVVNESNIEVVGDKIFFLQSKDGKKLPRINFAACWSDEPMPAEFVVVGEEIPAPALAVPPMALNETAEGYQLGLDFFRNDFVVQFDDGNTIPVPDITERPEEGDSFGAKVTETIKGIHDLDDEQ